MKHLLTIILLSVGLQVSAQVVPTLPAGSVAYSSQIYRQIIAGTPPDTIYWTGATNKGFVRLANYAAVLRLQDSIDLKANRDSVWAITGTQTGLSGSKSGSYSLNTSGDVTVGNTFQVNSSADATIDIDAAQGVKVILDRGGLTYPSLLYFENSATPIWDLGMRTGTRNFSLYNRKLSSLALSVDTVTSNMTLFGGLTTTTGAFSSTISANSVGSNIRLKGGNTDPLDGFVGTLVDGTIYLTNWADTRGIRIYPSGETRSLALAGTGTRVVEADSEGDLSAIKIIASGTYTPTPNNVLNASSITASDLRYARVGNIVQVSGYFIAAGTALGAVDVGVTLPVASNFTALTDLDGFGSSSNSTNASAIEIRPDTTNDKAIVRFISGSAGSTAQIHIFFSYTVQ